MNPPELMIAHRQISGCLRSVTAKLAASGKDATSRVPREKEHDAAAEAASAPQVMSSKQRQEKSGDEICEFINLDFLIR
jgi:hypothetical protein